MGLGDYSEVLLEGGQPIRGKRQIKAVGIFFRCLFRGNWKCARRELEIMSGRAKTFGVVLAPSFFESLKELDVDPEEFKEHIKEYFEKK